MTAIPQSRNSTKTIQTGPPKASAVTTANEPLATMAAVATRALPNRSATRPARTQAGAPAAIATKAVSLPRLTASSNGIRSA